MKNSLFPWYVSCGLLVLFLSSATIAPVSAFSWNLFSGWFSSQEQQMNQGLCKVRVSELPPGICCDANGKFVKCSSLTDSDHDENVPTSTPGAGEPPSGGSNSICYNGTGYCDWDYLKKYFNNDNLAAGRASGICQRESHSDDSEGSDNLSCLKQGGSMDYSIGLFQINLLAHCSSDLLKMYETLHNKSIYSGAAFTARDVFQYSGNLPVLPCRAVKDGNGDDSVAIQRRDLCRSVLRDPEFNIQKAAAMSNQGTNWKAWSTWAGLQQCEAEHPGGGEVDTTTPSPTPPTGSVEGCPDGTTRINAPQTSYQHLNQNFYCITPKIIVIHWSASWSSAQATFNVLNDRERSCQFATDQHGSLQMLDFYPDKVQKGWCVGGNWNDVSISIEITGSYFDDLIKDDPANPGKLMINPSHARATEMKAQTDNALALTCWSLKQYHIAKSEIYGHYELNNLKEDPGVQYLKYFKQRAEAECN